MASGSSNYSQWTLRHIKLERRKMGFGKEKQTCIKLEIYKWYLYAKVTNNEENRVKVVIKRTLGK